MSRERTANFGIVVAATLLFFLFSIQLVAFATFVLGGRVSVLPVLLGCVSASLFCWCLIRRFFERERVFVLIAVLLFLAAASSASLIVSGEQYDVSWDGQTYHQEAILQLANGWNPVRDPDGPRGALDSRLLIHYPKGPWIEAASLYKLTGNVEHGKAFNQLMVVAAFFLCFAALLTFRGLSVPAAGVLAFLLALNPVTVYQTLSFYVDGQLASLLLSFSSVLVLLFRRANALVSTTLLAVTVLAVNVKLTGLYYVVFFYAGFFLWFALKEKKVVGLKAFLAGFLIGAVVVGYNPYITNTLSRGNPLYPAIGSGSDPSWYWLIEHNTPQNLRGMDPFGKIFTSVFSQSQPFSVPSTLKLPFGVSRDELWAFGFPDVRVGGFGPMFGGSLILALVLVAWSLRLHLSAAVPAAVLVLAILASAVSIGEGWWARYAPQMWAVPVVAALLALSFDRKRSCLPYLGYLLTAVLLVNVSLVSQAYVRYQVERSQAVKRQLSVISSMPQPVEVDFSVFRSYRVRFEKAGIEYSVVEELRCPNPVDLPSSQVAVCPSSAAVSFPDKRERSHPR